MIEAVARRGLQPAGIWLLAVLLLVAAGLCLAVGPVSLAPATLLQGLVGRVSALDPIEQSVLYSIRLPRVAAGILVGAVLGVCGAAMQGLFRNPLADPGLIGVTAGAAFGCVVYLKGAAFAFAGISGVLGTFALPAFALLGGLATTALMYRIASVEGRTVVAVMLLAGIALNSLLGAGTGLVLFFSDDDQLRQFTFWTLGSLGHATWPMLGAALVFILPAFLVLPCFARFLDALLLGEAEALHLGIPLQQMKRILILVTAAAVGAAASLAGGIGFLGLVVPHLVRQVFGPGHRWLLPGSALLGAGLLLGADFFARTVAAPAELPVGVITAAIGAPVFFSLLLSGRRSVFF
ncbi:MAG: iron ABC transporter permease [Puniceicoccaceae bacterium]|nr:MAG: iron ABC transporter permease [Puniceicoccaceae bacterium]